MREKEREGGNKSYFQRVEKIKNCWQKKYSKNKYFNKR